MAGGRAEMLHALIGAAGEGCHAKDDCLPQGGLEAGRPQRVRQVGQGPSQPVVGQQQRARQVGREAVVLGPLLRGHVFDPGKRDAGHDISGVGMVAAR